MRYVKPTIVEAGIAATAIQFGQKGPSNPDGNGDPGALPTTGGSYHVDE